MPLRQASDYQRREGSQSDSLGWGWVWAISRAMCAYPFSAFQQRPPVWSPLSGERTPLGANWEESADPGARCGHPKKIFLLSVSSSCPWRYDARGVSLAKKTEFQNTTSCSSVYLRNTTSNVFIFPSSSHVARQFQLRVKFSLKKTN